MMTKVDVLKMKESFQERNIEIDYYDTREALLEALKVIVGQYNTIGVGNSQSLKVLGITETLSAMGKTVYDKTLFSSKHEITKVKKLALTSDCYISSANAISLDGKIVNVDHSGNRVAAITYGPEKVLLIVGTNKIEKTEQDAIKRALNVATPLNAKRAKRNPPCTRGEACSYCVQSERVCNYVSIIRGQHQKGRMKILVMDEPLGY